MEKTSKAPMGLAEKLLEALPQRHSLESIHKTLEKAASFEAGKEYSYNEIRKVFPDSYQMTFEIFPALINLGILDIFLDYQKDGVTIRTNDLDSIPPDTEAKDLKSVYIFKQLK